MPRNSTEQPARHHPGTAHIYCRVSSAGQEDNRSLATQEAACRAWAAERGLTVASVAREVWSGADRHRPELDALLDRLLPSDIVLAYALDRLSRSQVDTAIIIDKIEGAGASLALVTEDFERSATGTFLRNAKAFVVELEREKIGERTQRGRRARVASGTPIVGPKAPFGYHWGDAAKSRLVHDPETVDAVRLVFDMALAGLSLRRISDLLAEKGIASPSGGALWQPSSIREILLRDTYAGSVTTYRTRHERGVSGVSVRRPATAEETVLLAGVAEPIVTREELAAVAARLEHNKARSTRRNKHPQLSLLRAGYIVCGHCGWTLAVSNATPASRSLSPQYRCVAQRQHGPKCPRPSITASMIDAAVWEQVAAVLRDPSVIAREVARHRQDGGLERDLAAITKQLASVADRQRRTARAISAVDDDEASAPLLAELKSLADRKKVLAVEHDALTQKIKDQDGEDAKVTTLTTWCSRVGANLDTLSYDERRMAIDALGVQVRAYRNGSLDETGNPYPRWEMTMNPISPEEGIVFNPAR
jgi:site-specific DNA recombinase